jgi:hypothetical protein
LFAREIDLAFGFSPIILTIKRWLRGAGPTMVGRTTSKDPNEVNKMASFEDSLEDELSKNATSAAVAIEPKQRFVADLVEPTAKIATAVLGVLYVFGLLISNIQLMALGISDFSSIQARNVITGFGFIYYVAVLYMVILMTMVPIGGVLFMHYKMFKWGVRWGKGMIITMAASYIIVMAFAVGLFFVSACFAGAFEGFLVVYGHTWGDTVPFHIEFNQFSDLYMNFKILYASFWLTLAVAVPVIVPVLARGLPPLSNIFDRRGGIMKGIVAVYLLMALPFLLFDYADEVYPNIRYNLGGGQPQVAQLILTGKKWDLAGSPATVLCCGEGNLEQAVKTDEVAIWYQSDKFLYISRLSNVKRATSDVTAVDIHLIRDVLYLPKYYVRVSSGGVIDDVYPAITPR